MRRYAFPPRSARDIAPADIATLSIPGAAPRTSPHPRTEESRGSAAGASGSAEPATEHVGVIRRTSFIEPWPAAVEPLSERTATRARARCRAVCARASLARNRSQTTRRLKRMPPPAIDAAVYAPEAAPQWGADQLSEPSASSRFMATPRAFEPQPFEVPALPPINRPATREPVAPPYDRTRSRLRARLRTQRRSDRRARSRARSLRPPSPTLRHDVAAAWSPSPALRREPSFSPVGVGSRIAAPFRSRELAPARPRLPRSLPPRRARRRASLSAAGSSPFCCSSSPSASSTRRSRC